MQLGNNMTVWSCYFCTVPKTASSTYFKLEQLTLDTLVSIFSCSVAEYNEYLHEEARRSQSDHIALTWLLRERSTGKIAAYMSLVADAINFRFLKMNYMISITLLRPFPP
jgi:hypothetical protein